MIFHLGGGILQQTLIRLTIWRLWDKRGCSSATKNTGGSPSPARANSRVLGYVQGQALGRGIRSLTQGSGLSQLEDVRAWEGNLPSKLSRAFVSWDSSILTQWYHCHDMYRYPGPPHTQMEPISMGISIFKRINWRCLSWTSQYCVPDKLAEV